MGKYRVLITGKNNAIKNDFFNRMNDAFLVVSTSMCHDDIVNHLEFFSPEIIVFCLSDKKPEEWSFITEFRQRFAEREIVTVIVGSEQSCANFQRVAVNMVNLVLQQPVTANLIKKRIVGYMEELARKKEEERLRLEAEAEAERLRQEAEAERLCQEENRKHVLVIDDDPRMLKLIKEHLHEKYDVATAISGKIARKFLESKKTDLILLDYEMPVENGPEVLRKIRRDKRLEGIPVIFLTGTKQKEKITEALKLKPQGYLLKPIERDELLGEIKKNIG